VEVDGSDRRVEAPPEVEAASVFEAGYQAMERLAGCGVRHAEPVTVDWMLPCGAFSRPVKRMEADEGWETDEERILGHYAKAPEGLTAKDHMWYCAGRVAGSPNDVHVLISSHWRQIFQNS
jgi:hypothetical protein